MQFNKNTTSGKINIIVLIFKFFLGIIIIFGIIFFLNKIDFPAPKKDIEKIISNENFKIVK
jgi:heme/copper-type cytochrome/quinol oxidase subunit 4|tara:strand:+ start:37 stop:219 length:183 start_codon:yes stop_codon:yes gene_type:complete